MKKTLFIVFLMVPAFCSMAGDTLTLSQCYDKLNVNYPLVKQKDLLNSINESRIKNINKGYFPDFDFNAQATYQSDVVSIDIPIPGINIPQPAKDQYKTTVDFNQVLFDGGLISAQKRLEEANYKTELQKVEIDIYKAKEQVNSIYFSILLFQEKLKVLTLMSDEIKVRLKNMESGIKNGVFVSSDLDVLKAELLKLEQQTIEIKLGKSSAIQMLGEFLGENINENIAFQLPEVEYANSDSVNRPELALFSFQQDRLALASELSSKKRNPKLFGFGQVGYGRPGFNMLSDEFDTFYIVGAKVNWNIWDWSETNREKQIISAQENIIQTQREVFDRNVSMALMKEEATVEKYQELIKKDVEIIELRSKISKVSASQLENGVITPADYLTNFDAESQARIDMETHKIQLIQAKVNCLTIKGK